MVSSPYVWLTPRIQMHMGVKMHFATEPNGHLGFENKRSLFSILLPSAGTGPGPGWMSCFEPNSTNHCIIQGAKRNPASFPLGQTQPSQAHLRDKNPFCHWPLHTGKCTPQPPAAPCIAFPGNISDCAPKGGLHTCVHPHKHSIPGECVNHMYVITLAGTQDLL